MHCVKLHSEIIACNLNIIKIKWNFTNSQVHVNWFLYSLSNQIHRMLEVIECICGAENKHNDKLYHDKHYCSEQRLITLSPV